jgi:hypothetical protein
MLRQPCLPLDNPLHDLAHGHALARQGILIRPLLQRLLQRDGSRARARVVDIGVLIGDAVDQRLSRRRGRTLVRLTALTSPL